MPRMLHVRILGAVEAASEGETISLGGARTRLVLAMLALSIGQVVSRDRLVDALWESDPPDSATTQVAIHVSRLRKALGHPEAIETVGQGYRLMADGVAVDAVVAERTLREARESQRVELFSQALAMWRGPVLDGVYSPAIRPAAQRLEDLYLASVEDWSAAELDRGGERAVLEVLPEVVARNPLREGLRARLMEALWRGGRRADALASYDEGRRALADELGLDPGEELAGLLRRILQDEAPSGRRHAADDDETSVIDRPGSARGGRAAEVPRQLPMDVPHFAGRADDVSMLLSLVGADDRPGVVVGLHGPGGVGKTALAVHVAHQVADRFPDGQLFLNLHGYGTADPVNTSTALGSLLRSFGVPEAEIPPGEDDRSRKWRSVLAGRRILMVLDNARDSFQVRPLLPAGAATVLVTSRSQLRSLATREGAQRVHVQEMTRSEAVDLLQSRQSTQTRHTGTWAEPDVAELARLCGHLPVALAVAAERANRYPDRPLSELNAELRDSHTALDTLTAWEDDPATSVRAVMSWSYDALDAEAARMFRLMGLHPHHTMDADTAAALAGLDVSEAARLLDPLVESHLSGEPRPGEYEMHDLVHAFAARLAHSQVGDPERDEAVARMRAMYVHTIGNAASPFLRRPSMVPLPPLPSGVTPITFDDKQQTSRWFRDNERRLWAVLGEARECGDHTNVLTLEVFMAVLLIDHGRTHEGLEMNRSAVVHAGLAGDPEAEAPCIFRLGVALWKSGDSTAAHAQFIEAHKGYDRLGNREAALRALMAIGMMLGELDRHDEAVRALEAAVDSARSHRLIMTNTHTELLSNLAWVFVLAGRAREALVPAEEAVSAARREGEALIESVALDTIGLAHLQLEAPLEALRAFDRSLERDRVWPNIRHPYLYLNRGLAQRALGHKEQARDTWLRATEMMDELELRDSARISRSVLRDLLRELDGDGNGSPDESIQRTRQR